MILEQLKELSKDVDVTPDGLILKSRLHETVKFVRDTYRYDVLKEIAATDKGDAGIELLYRMYSTVHEEDFQITITVKDTAESISDLYDSAVADEKEIYDLFGVKFIGNPELKRLYMPENWEGNPLKKDYKFNDER